MSPNFYDMKHYPVSEPNIGKKELLYVQDAVKSGWVSSLGPYVTKFEESFAKFCGRTHGLSVSNGTHALHLALCALRIGPGDEVIVPNFTFVATANAVTYVGATPVFVDCDPKTWNMDPSDVEQSITKKTKAIMIVHLYGAPCDVDELLRIAKKHKIAVIEDAAEAHGATYKGRPCGSFGDISCFSFYGNKTITTGEGGMCVTNNKDLHHRMSLLRDHGMHASKKYWHLEVAYNYRITNLQAALGCAQLERMTSFIRTKNTNAHLYRKLLANCPGITVQDIPKNRTSNDWQFVILVHHHSVRDIVMEKLTAAGVGVRPTFYPMSELPPYVNHHSSQRSLAVSRNIGLRGICLPSSSTLKKSDIRSIAQIVTSVCASVLPSTKPTRKSSAA